MSQKDQVEEITNKLKEGIKDLFNSDRYKNFLSVAEKDMKVEQLSMIIPAHITHGR